MMCLYLDSSAAGARGVLSRKGVGRLRHLSCRILWMQDLVMEKRLLVRSVMGALNPADIATKRLSAARLESLCYFSGNIFRHLTNQQQQGHSQAQINLLISALSVLTQLQGCSDAMDSLATGGCFFNAVFSFTWLLGLIGYIYLAIRPGELLKSFDFVSDAAASSIGAGEDPIDRSSDTDASDHPAWSEEGMIHWLYDRCERRLQKAVTKQDPTKTNQYLARQGILSDMLAALEVATAETRGHIQQVLEDITDLSSDEDSPTMNTGGHATALNSGYCHSLCAWSSWYEPMWMRRQRLGNLQHQYDPFYNFGFDCMVIGTWRVHMVLAQTACEASDLSANDFGDPCNRT